MFSSLLKPAAYVLVVGLLAGCGGGGGGDGGVTFIVTAIDPNTSTDLNGGFDAIITGSGFFDIIVARVRFDNQIGFNVTVLSDTRIQVRVPPAPGGVGGSVSVTVESLENGQKQLFNAFTYLGGPPVPQLITPTNFTPTGAEQFTIQGTSLGDPGGTQNVNFVGIGVVVANVSLDGQFLTGRVPVVPIVPGVPPVGAVNVVVEPVGGPAVPVPTQVNYIWAPPQVLTFPGMTRGNASQPVRLADGYAVFCTAGVDRAWGTADDEIVILTGPPNPVSALSLVVGRLSSRNSIPAIMDGNTFVVYTIGNDALVNTADDVIVHVSLAQSASPVITPVPCPFMNSAPLVAVRSNLVVLTNAGADLTRATADDDIVLITFTGTLANIQHQSNAGPFDPAGGANAWSLPVSFDGDNVYLMTVGADGVPGNGDDTLVRQRVSSYPGGMFVVGAPFLAGKPIALGAQLLAAASGNGAPAGGVNDQLSVFADTGALINRLTHNLNTRVLVGAARPFVRHNLSGIAVNTAGIDTLLGSGDEVVRVFTNPVIGSFTDFPVAGQVLMAPLGNGGIAYWDPGQMASFLDTQVLNPVVPFNPAPPWPMGFPPLTDTNRAFVVDFGADGLPSSGDERLVVQQSLAIVSGISGSQLTLGSGALGDMVTGQEPFVPIGPNWGLIQGPGPNGTFGNVDDILILAQY